MSESRTFQVSCPDCQWVSREFEKLSGELAAKIDAAHHYVDIHGGEIPDDAEFGKDQCPKCHDILGMSGTVSCSVCGFVPEAVRA